MSLHGQSEMTILLVEDDNVIREILGRLMSLEGYHVVGAANGKEALDLLKTLRPKLILLDLMMPTMNGWEFAEALNKDTALAKIPVVVVSAFRDKEAGLNSRASLKKPVDYEQLVSTVRKFCA